MRARAMICILALVSAAIAVHAGSVPGGVVASVATASPRRLGAWPPVSSLYDYNFGEFYRGSAFRYLPFDLNGDGTLFDSVAGIARDANGTRTQGVILLTGHNTSGTDTPSSQAITDGMGLPSGTLHASSGFGACIAVPTFDVDGDAVARDIIVGTPGDFADGTDAGGLFVLSISGSQTVEQIMKISNGQNGMGSAVVSAGDLFGSSCVEVGWDTFNRGARRDVAVGAPGHSSGRGAVFLLAFAEPGFVAEWLIIAEGSGDLPNGALQSGSLFGTAVADVGFDANGDGFVSDLAVGAPGEDEGTGAVYIISLSNNASSVNGVVRLANGAGGLGTGSLRPASRFGTAIAAIKADVDLDGTSRDILVGAPTDDGAGADAGALFTLTLGGSATVQSHRKLVAGTQGVPLDVVNHAFDVLSVPNFDISGDNLQDDVFVVFERGFRMRALCFLCNAQPTTLSGGTKIWVDGDSPPPNGAVILGSSASTEALDAAAIGTALLSIAGDINGDGIARDMLIGASSYSSAAGAVYATGLAASSRSVLYAGRIANGDWYPTDMLSPGDKFGAAIQGLPFDCDGDGQVNDFLVGAPGASSGVGSVFVFSRQNTTPPVHSYTITNGRAGLGSTEIPAAAAFGAAVIDLAVDTNGDGIDNDIAVGAPGVDTVYVLAVTAASQTVTIAHRIARSQSGLAPDAIPFGSRFGASLVDLTPLFGTKFSFFVAGAPGFDNSTGATFTVVLDSGTQQASLYRLSNGAYGLPSAHIAPGSEFGSSLAVLAGLDGNGDGIARDVLIGAPGDSSNAGAVYVVTVTSTGNISTSRKLGVGSGGMPDGSILAGSRFGTSVASMVFDADGNGYDDDIAVGAPGSDRVFLLTLPSVNVTAAGVSALVPGRGGIDANRTDVVFAVDDCPAALGFDADGDGTARDVAIGNSANDKFFIFTLGMTGGAETITVVGDGIAGIPSSTIPISGSFGKAILWLPFDANEDGLPNELCVCADAEGSERGECYMLTMASGGTVAGISRTSEALSTATIDAGTRFGASLAALEHEGSSRIVLVGAPGARDGDGGRSGGVYAVPINADGSMNESAVVAISSGRNGVPPGSFSTGNYFGAAVARVDFDIHGLGLRSIAVGAPRARSGYGVVALLGLGVSLNVTVMTTLTPGTSGIPNGLVHLGWVLAPVAWDIDRDGSARDLVLQAPGSTFSLTLDAHGNTSHATPVYLASGVAGTVLAGEVLSGPVVSLPFDATGDGNTTDMIMMGKSELFAAIPFVVTAGKPPEVSATNPATPSPSPASPSPSPSPSPPVAASPSATPTAAPTPSVTPSPSPPLAASDQQVADAVGSAVKLALLNATGATASGSRTLVPVCGSGSAVTPSDRNATGTCVVASPSEFAFCSATVGASSTALSVPMALWAAVTVSGGRILRGGETPRGDMAAAGRARRLAQADAWASSTPTWTASETAFPGTYLNPLPLETTAQAIAAMLAAGGDKDVYGSQSCSLGRDAWYSPEAIEFGSTYHASWCPVESLRPASSGLANIACESASRAFACQLALGGFVTGSPSDTTAQCGTCSAVPAGTVTVAPPTLGDCLAVVQVCQTKQIRMPSELATQGIVTDPLTMCQVLTGMSRPSTTSVSRESIAVDEALRLDPNAVADPDLVVTSVLPSVVSATGPTQVTITGNGFGASAVEISSVSFGGIVAGAITSHSMTSLTVSMPACIGTGLSLRIVKADGSVFGGTSLAGGMGVDCAAPAITALRRLEAADNPPAIPAGSPATSRWFTLTGSNLGAGQSWLKGASIGGIECLQVDRPSESTARCLLPREELTTSRVNITLATTEQSGRRLALVTGAARRRLAALPSTLRFSFDGLLPRVFAVQPRVGDADAPVYVSVANVPISVGQLPRVFFDFSGTAGAGSVAECTGVEQQGRSAVSCVTPLPLGTVQLPENVPVYVESYQGMRSPADSMGSYSYSTTVTAAPAGAPDVVAAWRDPAAPTSVTIRWAIPSSFMRDGEGQALVNGFKVQVSTEPSFQSPQVVSFVKSVVTELQTASRRPGRWRMLEEGHNGLTRRFVVLATSSDDSQAIVEQQHEVFQVGVNLVPLLPVYARVYALSLAGKGPGSDATPPIPQACDDSSFLTTHLPLEEWACAACPRGANCTGGRRSHEIAPLPGFWLVPWSASNLVMEECPITSVCGGAPPLEALRLHEAARRNVSMVPAAGAAGMLALEEAANQTGVSDDGRELWRVASYDDVDWDALSSPDGGWLPNTSTIAASTAVYEHRQSGCHRGYGGVVCSTCIDGYSRKGTFECELCPPQDLAGLRVFGLVVVAMICLGLVIAASVAGASATDQSVAPTVLKIILSHLQTVAIAATFSITWPQAVIDMMDSYSALTSVASTEVLSMECMTGVKDVAAESSWFSKAVLTFVAPFIVIVLIAIVWATVWCIMAGCSSRILCMRMDDVPGSSAEASRSRRGESGPQSRDRPKSASRMPSPPEALESVSVHRHSQHTSSTSAGTGNRPSLPHSPVTLAAVAPVRGGAMAPTAQTRAHGHGKPGHGREAAQARWARLRSLVQSKRLRFAVNSLTPLDMALEDSAVGARQKAALLLLDEMATAASAVAYRWRVWGLFAASVFALLFLVQPSLTSVSLQGLSCRNVGSGTSLITSDDTLTTPVATESATSAVAVTQSRLFVDLALECTSARGSAWLWGVALPALLVFGLGIPALAIHVLVVNRDRLDSPLVRRAYGFLYANVRLEAAWWEASVMLRKTALAMAAVLTPGVAMQVYAGMLVVFAFGALQARVWPYTRRSLNILEVTSLCVIFFTLWAGVTMVAPGAGNTTRVGLSAVVVLFNVVFIVFAAIVFVDDKYNSLRESWFGNQLCCCLPQRCGCGERVIRALDGDTYPSRSVLHKAVGASEPQKRTVEATHMHAKATKVAVASAAEHAVSRPNIGDDART